MCFHMYEQTAKKNKLLLWDINGYIECKTEKSVNRNRNKPFRYIGTNAKRRILWSSNTCPWWLGILNEENKSRRTHSFAQSTTLLRCIGGSDSKELACCAGDPGFDPLVGKGMATHSSIPAWRIPWKEEPGGLQSMGSQRVGHNWVTNTYTHTHTNTLIHYTEKIK